MKIENLPVMGATPSISELDEYELYELYDGYLMTLGQLRRLYVLSEELPDILIEAAAFRLGCNDHETGTFGWCPWEVDDPTLFSQIGRFLERCGQHELREEVQDFEAKLSKFNANDLQRYFTHAGDLAEKTSDAINDVIANGFNNAKFSTDVWVQTARCGVELIQSLNIFQSHPDFESVSAAQRAIVEALPDYESRKPQKTIWSVDLPFHQLLVSVGERYFHNENLKTTRPDGSLLLSRDAHKFDEISAFEQASKVHLLESTKREWLCCEIGDTTWLVDPKTSKKVASA